MTDQSHIPLRVCDSCYSLLLGPETPLSNIQLSANLEFASNNSLLNVDESDTMMSECPVCQMNLKELEESLVEDHVKSCLDQVSNVNSQNLVMTTSGHRYLIQTIKQDQLQNMECSICFEDFILGKIVFNSMLISQDQEIARLDCLCIYHHECIRAWFVKQHSCPLHARLVS